MQQRLTENSEVETDETSAASAALVGAEPDDGEIEALVDQIRGLKRDAAFLFVTAVGRLVVDRFYDGDVSRCRQDRGRAPGYRKLAERLKAERGLGLDHTALARAVGVYGLVSATQAVATSQHLKVGHYVAVLGLPVTTAERLLTMADAEKWSVAELRNRVGRNRDTPRRGRRPQLPFVRGIQRLRSLLDQKDVLLVGTERAAELPPEQADALLDTLEAFSAEVERLKAAIRARGVGADAPAQMR
jgi:hypothetical protein